MPSPPSPSDLDVDLDLDVDVLVAGGGPAGCATALVLSRAGWSTAVVGRARRPRGEAGESLPSVARPLLERLGLIDAFASAPHRRVRANRSCWGESQPRERPALLTPYGEGWHLDREHFDAMLRTAAAAAGASFIDGRVRAVRAQGMEEEGEGERRRRSSFVVHIGGDAAVRTARARGVVDATGRAGGVARALGARSRRVDRLLAACTQSARHAPRSGFDAVGLVEASPDGWWYSAPLPSGPYAVQFVTRPELWRAPGNMPARLRYAPHTHARVGSLADCPPAVVAAHSACASPCAGPGWIAVGDAAAAHDPLAAAGLTMALRSGLRAAHALACWLLDGDTAALERYSAMHDAAFAHYLRQRSRLYALERRWPRAAFWAVETSRGRRLA